MEYPDWWDVQRWDDELSADLYGTLSTIMTDVGRGTTAGFGYPPASFNDGAVENFLRAIANRLGTDINSQTFAKLETALKAAAPMVAAHALFAYLRDHDAPAHGEGLAAQSAGIGSTEAARQFGGDSARKVWHTGPNPRPSHARMNGETVGIDDSFSNGAAWPGDSVLDADERAGCNCWIEVEIGYGKRKFNPGQPRDQRGRWTTLGGGGFGVADVSYDLHNGFQTFVEPDSIEPLMGSLKSEPPCNLANLQVMGDGNGHLYRDHAREIPRSEMPQLPENLEGLRGFSEALRTRGIRTELTEVDPRSLRMTQNQLKSTQVATLYDSIRSGGWREGTFILTDRDGNILDGHHRWAAASAFVAAGGDFKLPTVRIDTDIDTLLAIGNEMSGMRVGIAAGRHMNKAEAEPNPNEPWLYLWDQDKWVLIGTDTADGVPPSLDDLQPFATDEQDDDGFQKAWKYEPGQPRDQRGRWVHTGYAPIARTDFSDPNTPRTRGVSADEFQRLAADGQRRLKRLRGTSSPPKGLDENWRQIGDDAYSACQSEWGGVTINSHTGKPYSKNTGYAMTVKPERIDSVHVRIGASREEFEAGMVEARQRFDRELSYQDHHLGVFRDDAIGTIDFDPVIVVPTLDDVETIGAYTHALGGAYNIADGNGYWPPYVTDEAA